MVTALLPVLVALFHLLPALPSLRPVEPAEIRQEHQHRQHAGSMAHHAVAEIEQADERAAGAPFDKPSRHQGAGHCPLCFWLQGLHALPAPTPTIAPPRTGLIAAPSWPDLIVPVIRRATAAQPRGPPASPRV